MNYNIAVILTCYNRREKTVACLNRLFAAQAVYNAHSRDNREDTGRTFDKLDKTIGLKVFLTDDGCTDGTGDAVREAFAQQDICVLKGTGSLYWAGGMRFAWKEALKEHAKWDFYLLLNDDTLVLDNVFEELFAAHEYALQTFDKAGLYSGVTCATDDPSVITYSGDLTTATGKWSRLDPNGTPQMVDQTNANVLLVAKEVVDEIGIFYEGYIHSAADWDYSILARKAGCPALITANVCGECDFDHTPDVEIMTKLAGMKLAERRRYFKNPVNHDRDHMVFVRRHSPLRLPVAWILRNIRCYWPSFYIWINKKRGIYK